MTSLALDTSVAVPLLLASHPAHDQVTEALAPHLLSFTGHSCAETYSVLTRLPGDARLATHDAAALLEQFGEPALADARALAGLPRALASLGISGGAVYDALVALGARHAGLPLATRDGRAVPTYRALGVEVVVVG